MSEYRIAIMKDGKYLAEDHHSNEGCYWTSFCDPFVLCFDTPELANKIACNFANVTLSPIDFDEYLLHIHNKPEYIKDILEKR